MVKYCIILIRVVTLKSINGMATREDKEYTNIEYHVLEVSKKVDEIIDYLKSKGE